MNLDEKALILVQVYSDPARDPRGHTVSIAYATILHADVEPKAGSDAEDAEWVSDWANRTLAFDHSDILSDAKSLIETHYGNVVLCAAASSVSFLCYKILIRQ